MATIPVSTYHITVFKVKGDHQKVSIPAKAKKDPYMKKNKAA